MSNHTTQRAGIHPHGRRIWQHAPSIIVQSPRRRTFCERKAPLVIILLDEAYRAASDGRFPGHEPRYYASNLDDAATFARLLEPATVLGLRRPPSFPFDPSLFDAAGDLQFIQKSGSGADWFDVDALNARGILLATNVGVNAPSVAEHAVLLTLLCLRGVFAPMQQMQRGVWDRIATTPPAVLLDGKTVGIIGVGSIGTRVARAMLGLGARVIATRPRPGGPARRHRDIAR